MHLCYMIYYGIRTLRDIDVERQWTSLLDYIFDDFQIKPNIIAGRNIAVYN